jgi:hypothetical protein
MIKVVQFTGNATELGQWHHLVAVYDGSYISLYYNGVRVNHIKACMAPSCGKIVYP